MKNLLLLISFLHLGISVVSAQETSNHQKHTHKKTKKHKAIIHYNPNQKKIDSTNDARVKIKKHEAEINKSKN